MRSEFQYFGIRSQVATGSIKDWMEVRKHSHWRESEKHFHHRARKEMERLFYWVKRRAFRAKQFRKVHQHTRTRLQAPTGLLRKHSAGTVVRESDCPFAIRQDNEKWRWEFSSPPQCSFVKSFLYVKCSSKSWSKKCFPSFPLSLGHSHTKWRTERCFGSSIRLRN